MSVRIERIRAVLREDPLALKEAGRTGGEAILWTPQQRPADGFDDRISDVRQSLLTSSQDGNLRPSNPQSSAVVREGSRTWLSSWLSALAFGAPIPRTELPIDRPADFS